MQREVNDIKAIRNGRTHKRTRSKESPWRIDPQPFPLFIPHISLVFPFAIHTTNQIMRRLCPNIDRDDGLETILEVPIPEEMFTSMGSNVTLRWQNMSTWMKAQTSDKWSSPIIANRFNELRFLLYLVGSPLIPLQVQLGHSVHRPVRDCSIVRFLLFLFLP